MPTAIRKPAVSVPARALGAPAARAALTEQPAPAVQGGWKAGPAKARSQVQSPLSVRMPTDPKTYSPATAKGAAALADLAYQSPQEIRSKLLAAGYTNVEFIENGVTGTQAFVASRGDAVVVGFRGTSSLNDVTTDLIGGAGLLAPSRFGGQMHDGFLTAYQSVERQITDAVNRAKGGNPNKPILFSGHSLGGALAQIAATDLREKGATIAGVYTFGQPRVGDKGFCDHYKALGLGAKTFRHINQNDPVPCVPKLHVGSIPSNVLGWLRGEEGNRFKHVGHIIYFDQSRARSMNPSDEKMHEAWKDTSLIAKWTNGSVAGLASLLRSGPKHVMAEYLSGVNSQMS